MGLEGLQRQTAAAFIWFVSLVRVCFCLVVFFGVLFVLVFQIRIADTNSISADVIGKINVLLFERTYPVRLMWKV